MATKKHSSGGFAQMPKMMTDEPSVILKLKKGGHVSAKRKEHEEHGHKGMQHTEHHKKHHSEHEEHSERGEAPKKPSMSERRKAMSGSLLMSKKGGKVEKHEEHEIHKLEKELKHHEHEKAGKAHHGLKSGGPASGAAIDKFETKTTVKGNANKFAKTKVVDGDKLDKHHGTGEIRDGKTAAFKTGGTIEGNERKFEKTDVVDGSRKDTAHGTKGIKETNGGGYAKGGGVEGNVSSTPPGVTNRATGGVKEANAGGYKKGGHAKKHFATGGSVNSAGQAVAMPKHFVSKPVSNTAQSGTFKKGGHIKKFAEGGDMSKGGYDASMKDIANRDMPLANTIRNAPGEAYSAAKRLLGIKPEAGAGRGSVNPPMARKRGGSAKR